MPYKTLSDLPDAVREHLPKHAREIYLAAFNSAWEQYGQEDVSHKVAWAAVKQQYEKQGDKWKRKKG